MRRSKRVKFAEYVTGSSSCTTRIGSIQWKPNTLKIYFKVIMGSFWKNKKSFSIINKNYLTCKLLYKKKKQRIKKMRLLSIIG